MIIKSNISPYYIKNVSEITDINTIRKNTLEFLHTGIDTFEQSKPSKPTRSLSENIINLYNKTKEENKQIFLKHILPENRKIVDKICSLPDYKDDIIPFLVDKKRGELQYLYKIAAQRDITGNLRIPVWTFPFFSEIPIEKLKALEPIIGSKNKQGGWNYIPKFILDLDQNYNSKQIAIMSKLAGNKVNAYDLRFIGDYFPLIKHNRIIEKTNSINTLFGKNLKEIGFCQNEKDELFMYADIKLSEIDKKTNTQKFRRVYTLINENISPQQTKKSNSDIDTHINHIYDKLNKKLHVYTEDDLNNDIKSILSELPDTTEEEILCVMQRLTQFANYSCLKPLTQKFNAQNIGRFEKQGDINQFFDYFNNSKKLFTLALQGMQSSKKAFLVTQKTLSEPENLKNLLAQDRKKICFINLEGWENGVNLLSDDKNLKTQTKTILCQAKQILKENPNLCLDDAIGIVLNSNIENTAKQHGLDLKTIRLDAPATKSVILEQMSPIMPTKSLLKSTIESIANHFTENEDEYNKLCKKIAEYYDKNLNPHSKQSIIENLKYINKSINEYLKNNNLSSKNLYLINPNTDSDNSCKSFQLINRMFADLFNIPKERNIDIGTIYNVNKYPPNSTFVILDDFIGSGSSMIETENYMFVAPHLPDNQHVLFCPIAASQHGLDFVNNFINIAGRQNNDKIICNPENIKNYVKPTELFSDIANKELVQKVFGEKGHDDGGMCTVFPYMAPDNNSSLAGYLTKFFTPDIGCIKTQNNLLPVIEEETYYYDIFGTDKKHILSETYEEYIQRQNPILEFLNKP